MEKLVSCDMSWTRLSLPDVFSAEAAPPPPLFSIKEINRLIVRRSLGPFLFTNHIHLNIIYNELVFSHRMCVHVNCEVKLQHPHRILDLIISGAREECVKCLARSTKQISLSDVLMTFSPSVQFPTPFLYPIQIQPALFVWKHQVFAYSDGRRSLSHFSDHM